MAIASDEPAFVMLAIRKYLNDPRVEAIAFDYLHFYYPRAAHCGATIYHYGWIRNEEQMNLKTASVQKYWQNRKSTAVDYTQN